MSDINDLIYTKLAQIKSDENSIHALRSTEVY